MGACGVGGAGDDYRVGDCRIEVVRVGARVRRTRHAGGTGERFRLAVRHRRAGARGGTGAHRRHAVRGDRLRRQRFRAVLQQKLGERRCHRERLDRQGRDPRHPARRGGERGRAGTRDARLARPDPHVERDFRTRCHRRQLRALRQLPARTRRPYLRRSVRGVHQRRDRAASVRADAPRLRHQRLPRAEDPRRRDLAARRNRLRRGG